MEVQIQATPLSEVQDLRNLSLQESDFQFVHDKCHGAGWADTYKFLVADGMIGYGSVWGKDDRNARDTIFEFYILPPRRHLATLIFQEFRRVSRADFIECQTNNDLQSEIFFEFAQSIEVEAILFEDYVRTELSIADTVFKRNENNDGPEYVLDHEGQRVAGGGFVRNYNFPYIDMYYEVEETYKRKGFGSLFTQELKKEAYRLNRVPSARCNKSNVASKATLLKAGMRVCGHMLIGKL